MSSIQAQMWLETGSTWHYVHSTISSGGFEKLVYTQDQLFQGKWCQKIDRDWYHFTTDQNGQVIFDNLQHLPHIFTYSEGDSVFRWNYHEQEFMFLYDFGAAPGDTWLVDTQTSFWEGCSDSSWVTVIDTGAVIISGTSRRFLEVKREYLSPYVYNGTVVEGIGIVNVEITEDHFMLPVEVACDSVLLNFFDNDRYGFSCFQSDLSALYNPSGEDCEYLLTYLDVPDLYKEVLNIYPVPARNLLNIQVEATGSVQLKILDISGKVVGVKSVDNWSGSTFMPIEELSVGLYFVRFENEVLHITQRFVKH